MFLAIVLAFSAEQADAAAPPKPASKFPIVAEIDRVGIGSATTLSYDIGKDGRVKNCVVTISSGSKFLDDGACDIMIKKAKYRPKRDTNGEPVDDVGRTMRMVWNIED